MARPLYQMTGGGPVLLDPCSNPASAIQALHRWHGLRCPCTSCQLGVGVATRISGLAMPWSYQGVGLVFVNPPYGDAIVDWAEKIAREAALKVEMIGLLPSRTDTAWMHEYILATATAICLCRGRFRFNNPPTLRWVNADRRRNGHEPLRRLPKNHGRSPSIPSVIPYWGTRVDRFVDAFSGIGLCCQFDTALASRERLRGPHARPPP